MRPGSDGEFSAPELAERLAAFARGRGASDLLPWVERLSPEDRARLRADLSVVLAETETTGEPLDWREIGEILSDWAQVAGWEESVVCGPALEKAVLYTVELPPQDAEQLERAPAAVQTATRQCLAEFLPFYPTAGLLLPRGRLKRMKDRDLWQVHLPDGYRLRYLVDKPSRVVRVVYFGRHPDHDPRGREERLRARNPQGELLDG
jgi:mRNA-degrading endonuclease RelE of RelBE toxin-antitoxin system